MIPSVKSSAEPDRRWTLDDLPRGECPPGVYRFQGRTRPDPLLSRVAGWGWQPVYLDGLTIDDKPSFLVAAGRAFAFPTYAGRNWDAFEELIQDLSWLAAPGYVVLYDRVHRFAGHHPTQWQTALEIFRHAAATWQAEQVPFYVLLRHTWRTNRHLPVLAESQREGNL